MKVKNLIQRLYGAIRSGRTKLERKIYEKITRKSLKHKHTQAVR